MKHQKEVGGWEKPWSNHPMECLLLRKGLRALLGWTRTGLGLSSIF